MPYVVTSPCLEEKNGSCVEVCPVDCIHTDDGATQYFIDPTECIDCGACAPACPVEAIHAVDDVPPGQEMFVRLNAEYFAR
jgi:ferredoxin